MYINLRINLLSIVFNVFLSFEARQNFSADFLLLPCLSDESACTPAFILKYINIYHMEPRVRVPRQKIRSRKSCTMLERLKRHHPGFEYQRQDYA
jgi:hypothetical protein